jgi:murein DD-endopeptidase MepM/ murein hydrolase activator NlpD
MHIPGAAAFALASLVFATAPAIAAGPAAAPLIPAALTTPVTTAVPVGWRWPITSVRISRGWTAPAHEYGAGHRGIDLAAPVGTPALAPAPGAVAFAGTVAGRGVITIDHGGGWVTTLEPVSAQLAPGTIVAVGDTVARVGTGGHAEVDSVHFGVRYDGIYVNPLLLLGGIPRAVLLPCC